MTFQWFSAIHIHDCSRKYLAAYCVPLFRRITGIFQQKKMSMSLKKLRRTRVNEEIFLRFTRHRLIRAINIFH